MMIKKIISGGQTGADRAALDAAKMCSIPTGGIAPKGWRICNFDGSDGSDPSLAELGLVEHSSKEYSPRTKQNVADADGTLIVGYLESPGCKLTIKTCKEMGKLLLLNPESPEELKQWVINNNIEVLNVAGNRLSEDNPNIYTQVFCLVWEAFVDKEPHIGKVYTHYKGEDYVVETLAKDEKTEEEMVIYRNLLTREAWVRPSSAFIQLLFLVQGELKSPLLNLVNEIAPRFRLKEYKK